MRISWIDNSKAIAMILVVFGHTKGLGTSFKDVIYSFHIPLFFFLAGFLLKDKYLDKTFRSFTLRNIKRLLVPYASFWVISYFYWLLTHSMRNELQQSKGSLTDPFIGLLFGVGETLEINGVLWFFTCLFCTSSFFYWISKVRDKKLMLLILLFLGFLGPLIHLYLQTRLPWNFELSFVAIVFYGIGYLVSKSETFHAVTTPKQRFIAIAVLCGTLLLTVKFNGSVNMNRMQFGNLVLFYLGAFSGIGVTILLSQSISGSIFSEWLSTNTIVIFPLHTLIFSFFTGIGVIVFGLEYTFKENLVFSVLYTIGAFAVCIPVSYILRSYFPLIIGRKPILSHEIGIRLFASRPKSTAELRCTDNFQIKERQNE